MPTGSARTSPTEHPVSDKDPATVAAERGTTVDGVPPSDWRCPPELHGSTERAEPEASEDGRDAAAEVGQAASAADPPELDPGNVYPSVQVAENPDPPPAMPRERSKSRDSSQSIRGS